MLYIAAHDIVELCHVKSLSIYMLHLVHALFQAVATDIYVYMYHADSKYCVGDSAEYSTSLAQTT